MTTAEAEARALLVTERELEKLQATLEYKKWSAQNGRTAKKSLVRLGATIAILSILASCLLFAASQDRTAIPTKQHEEPAFDTVISTKFDSPPTEILDETSVSENSVIDETPAPISDIDIVTAKLAEANDRIQQLHESHLQEVTDLEQRKGNEAAVMQQKLASMTEQLAEANEAWQTLTAQAQQKVDDASLSASLPSLAALITITVGLISYTIMTKKLDTTQQAHRALKEHCKTMKASLTQENQRLRDSEAETRTWAELADAKAEQTSHKLRQATAAAQEAAALGAAADERTAESGKRVKEAEDQAKATKEECAQLAKDNINLTRLLDASKVQVVQTNRKVKEAEGQVLYMEDKFSEAKDTAKVMKEARDRAEANVLFLTKQLTDCDQKIVDLQNELSKEKEALKVSETDKRRAEDIILKQYNEYERVISDLDSQIKEAKIDALQAVEEKESEISKLQDKLEAAEKSRNNINTETLEFAKEAEIMALSRVTKLEDLLLVSEEHNKRLQTDIVEARSQANCKIAQVVELMRSTKAGLAAKLKDSRAECRTLKQLLGDTAFHPQAPQPLIARVH